MTLTQLRDTLDAIHYPGFEFSARQLACSEGFIVSGVFRAPCSVRGGPPVAQYTREWFIAPDSTEHGVVTTVLKLVLAAIEHEAREFFRYHGRMVFDPHAPVL